MTPEALRLLVRIHGVIAWGAIASLLVSLILAIAPRLARPPRLTLAVALASVLGGASFVTGALLHGSFQIKLRQRLFLLSNALGWLFERKEHVAFGALALLGCAACATWAERIARGRDDAVAAMLGRAQKITLGAALAFEAFAVVVSLATSARVGF